MTSLPQNRAGLAIAFVLFGAAAISINDMLIKQLSGGYPLHEVVFARSFIGIMFTMIILHYEGGFRILRTDTPWLHLLRGALVVVANMTFFLAIAAMPLADATAMFFVAPLFITLLSIPILGEKVGPVRLIAVLIGFAGVVIMQRPWEGADQLQVSRLVLLLPIIAAFTYAMNQVMTRKLGVKAKASAMSIYIQATFIVASLGFFAFAGDGRFVTESSSVSMQFLLREWVWPSPSDWWILIGMGCNAAVIGYCLSQAYRLADAAVIAPFEYIGLPLAVFWGLVIFGDLPVWEVWVGIGLIIASGVFVFLRERKRARDLPHGSTARRQ